jgi:ribosomal-protein-alanine N-acetyltransferase
VTRLGRPRAALEVGDRVYLRAPRARDAAMLATLVRRSRRLHRPRVYPPASVEAVARLVARARRPERRTVLVCWREDGAAVRLVNVREIVRGALQGAYLGYYAFAPHAGQGYMTEGLALVLRHAFRRLRLHRLEANIQPANRASRALVERLGFRREGFSPRYLKVGGRWRDHERWAILREQWAAMRTRAPGGVAAPGVPGAVARAGAAPRPPRRAGPARPGMGAGAGRSRRSSRTVLGGSR